MMEYLITMAVYLLIVIAFLLRWCDSFAEKLVEKLKEIGPPVKAEDKASGFSPPPGKVAVLTLKGHPLGEGVLGHIEGYVTDGGIAYALMIFGNDLYRHPVKDVFKDYPKPASGSPNLWPEHWYITAATGSPSNWNSAGPI